MTEIETGSKIPIWWTFGLIQWYVIPAPRATLHGERIPSAILKVVFRRIAYFFCFPNAVWLWRAAAFVSSSIHFFHDRCAIICWHCCSAVTLGHASVGVGYRTLSHCRHCGERRVTKVGYEINKCVSKTHISPYAQLIPGGVVHGQLKGSKSYIRCL